MQACCFFFFFFYLTDTHLSHPFPIYILKACIKINFGVVKLLYVPSHIQYLFIYIYIDMYKSLPVYRTVQKCTF